MPGAETTPPFSIAQGKASTPVPTQTLTSDIAVSNTVAPLPLTAALASASPLPLRRACGCFGECVGEVLADAPGDGALQTANAVFAADRACAWSSGCASAFAWWQLWAEDGAIAQTGCGSLA
eukprot:6214397-Pleurochrysis_carterae.AAC.3